MRITGRIASAALLILTACSSAIENYPTLRNQGILPLSTTNAYVGSNLFIANEFQRSDYLFNFLKGRGAPTAIELIEEGMSAPRMLMFYPKDKEVYAADLMRKGESREWVIRGPFRIERKDYKELARLDLSMVGEPVFEYQGRQHRFRFQPDEHQVVATVATPVPTPKPKKTVKKTTIITKPEDVGVKPAEWKPLNSDQQAIQMAQGFAERAQNGDVIHTVTADNQTLEAIAKWYTGTESNFKAIAQANGIADGGKPTIGQRIQIPMGMVKQFKALK